MNNEPNKPLVVFLFVLNIVQAASVFLFRDLVNFLFHGSIEYATWALGVLSVIAILCFQGVNKYSKTMQFVLGVPLILTVIFAALIFS